MKGNIVVAIVCGLVLTLGPYFEKLTVDEGPVRDFFPSTTTILGSLIALVFLPICDLKGDLLTDRRLAWSAAITVSLVTMQLILGWQAKLSYSVQISTLHVSSVMCLLGLASHALFKLAMRTFFDLLGLSIALLTTSDLLLQGLPNDSEEERHAAILALVSGASLGLLYAFIVLQLQAISPRQQISEFSKDDSREVSADPPDRVTKSADWSARRTYIFLLVVQIVFSIILFLSTELSRVGSVQIRESFLRAVSKAAVLLLVILATQCADHVITTISLAILLLTGHYIAEGMTLRDIGLGIFCVISYSRLRTFTVHVKKIYLVCIILLALCQWQQYRKLYFAVHPIRVLMKDAQKIAENFQAHESTIVNLQTAVDDYQSRYMRPPPPGFDHWWNYSQQQGALVVSNFDQIARDLRPFWNLEPRVIRERTYTAIRDRNNYISPLRVRNGAVMAPPMLIPTHYWMLEGLMAMMEDFVQFLPDMDIAINLNDEPRVLARTQDVALTKTLGKASNFSLTKEHWLEDIPFKEERPESFTKVERELRNTFDISTRFCLASKSKRVQSPPRSLVSHFLPNWRESLDICKATHLKNSRGFFISPASFDVTDELMPIFSQSKPSTFSDILLPSPWNFNDKVGPDTDDQVPWSEKSDRVYWRGTTTEGWATWGSWRSMLRQRMVDILRGAHSFALNPSTALILQGSDREGYHSTEQTIPELARQFDPDVFFVEIVRSDEADRNDQMDHFELQPPNEFKEHWKHRYLLDTDGAAFSGRFLPFLQSRSLPLKFTSVFTEWWSDRVFAYQHFVPVTLESIYDVLTYFIGIQADGASTGSEGHPHEALAIAKLGEVWSKRTLRKADMKIYLFRLLLEYGRLVDDKRDEIGFILE